MRCYKVLTQSQKKLYSMNYHYNLNYIRYFTNRINNAKPKQFNKGENLFVFDSLKHAKRHQYRGRVIYECEGKEVPLFSPKNLILFPEGTLMVKDLKLIKRIK